MRNKKKLTPEQKLKYAKSARLWQINNPEKVKEHAKRSRIKNRDKILARQKIWTKNNKERHSKQAKIWYNENKEKTRNTRLVRDFGITLEEYNELLNKQNNSCAICGGLPGLRCYSVDHDHISGKVRGLLCRGCNVGIGNLKDDPELLEKAIMYIKNLKRIFNMCYSGKCIWEQSSGDCGFPDIKEVREKYQLPLCEIDNDNEEDRKRLQEMIEEVKQIVHKHNN